MRGFRSASYISSPFPKLSCGNRCDLMRLRLIPNPPAHPGKRSFLRTPHRPRVIGTICRSSAVFVRPARGGVADRQVLDRRYTCTRSVTEALFAHAIGPLNLLTTVNT